MSISLKFTKVVFTTLLFSLVFLTSLPAEETSSETSEKEQTEINPQTNDAAFSQTKINNFSLIKNDLVVEATDKNISNLPVEKNLPSPKTEEKIISKAKDYVASPFVNEFEELLLLKTGEALILLTDNSRWIIRNFSEEEQALYEQAPWQKKDEVRLMKRTTFDRQGNFSIKNVRTNQVYPVHFDTTSLKHAKTHMIDKIDSNGYFVSTSDKIDWEIFWTSSWTSCLWRPFDRLLISKGECTGKNTYQLINLSTQEAVNAEIIQWK